MKRVYLIALTVEGESPDADQIIEAVAALEGAAHVQLLAVEARTPKESAA